MSRRLAVVLGLVIAASVLPAAAARADGIRRVPDAIGGRYIVTVDAEAARDLPATANDMARRYGGDLVHVYGSALDGFAIAMPEGRANALARDPRVTLVEEDGLVLADATQSPATWGLDRIDQRDLPLTNSYLYNATGAGVKAYVLDTGIRLTHTQFGGRAIAGTDTVGDGQNGNDCHGHGTHVAGTVGGSVHGVAKGVTLVNVRVLNCQGSGSWSGVIAGIDWVTADHPAGAPAVANMSLGGGLSSSVNSAVARSVADGVTYAVAAGNSNADACNSSPSSAADALTVGSTTSSDARSSFSNWGTCLDIFAPGSSITSASYTSDTATTTMSGTSMASPHVAGAAALYLEGNTAASPATVGTALASNATTGKVTSPGTGSPNLLLYTAFIGPPGPPPPNQPPVASFTHACTDLSCSFTDTSTDADGSVTGWAWNFGDGSTSTTRHPSHTYAAAGSYTVTLVATDDDGASSSPASVTVTVTDPPPPPAITLSTRGYKVKGQQKADLTWSGAGGTNVDVWRNGAKIVTTANDGTYTDPINRKGGGSYVYQVCEAGTTTCSNTSTVTF